jgi:hypothetical protein
MARQLFRTTLAARDDGNSPWAVDAANGKTFRLPGSFVVEK